jgi:hypothetical protein
MCTFLPLLLQLLSTRKELRTTQLFISKTKQKTSNKTIKTHLNGVIVVPSNL